MVTALSVIVLISSVVLIVSVLMQEGRDDAMGALLGQGSNEAIWGANRGRSKEATLKRVTAISAAIFMVGLLVLAAL